MTADNIQDDSASRKGRDETNDREEQFRRWAHLTQPTFQQLFSPARQHEANL
jgi:hypothetical protein